MRLIFPNNSRTKIWKLCVGRVVGAEEGKVGEREGREGKMDFGRVFWEKWMGRMGQNKSKREGGQEGGQGILEKEREREIEKEEDDFQLYERLLS